VYLQINTVKYDADQEITNVYENLQIIQSQFFTDMLLFVYIRSTSNIYWFIYLYLDLLPMNTNEKLFGYFQLFVIFSQLFDER
jgi:hypothetical protein